MNSSTAPCLLCNQAGAASMAGAWFIHWPVRPMRGLYRPVDESTHGEGVSEMFLKGHD